MFVCVSKCLAARGVRAHIRRIGPLASGGKNDRGTCKYDFPRLKYVLYIHLFLVGSFNFQG